MQSTKKKYFKVHIKFSLEIQVNLRCQKSLEQEQIQAVTITRPTPMVVTTTQMATVGENSHYYRNTVNKNCLVENSKLKGKHLGSSYASKGAHEHYTAPSGNDGEYL